VNQAGDPLEGHETCFNCGQPYCKSGLLHNNLCDHCYVASDAGSHALCGVCESFICYGSHGEGVCNIEE